MYYSVPGDRIKQHVRIISQIISIEFFIKNSNIYNLHSIQILLFFEWWKFCKGLVELDMSPLSRVQQK